MIEDGAWRDKADGIQKGSQEARQTLRSPNVGVLTVENEWGYERAIIFE